MMRGRTWPIWSIAPCGAEGWSVRDVGSLNGTYVNRVRVEDQQLNGGDEVQIGKFRFVFLLGLDAVT